MVMSRNTFISALVLAAAAVLPAAAASGRNSITTEQVSAAMARAGMQVSAKQVELLSDVVAATPSPTLKIRSMEPWGDNRMMVRFDCGTPDECVPFFVAVRLVPVNAPSDAGGNDAHPSGSRHSTSNTSTSVVATIPDIRSGSTATLIIEGGHVHIKIPVVTMENGSIGQTIRVSSRDRKQSYTAEVIDGTLLRASL
jgi:Chaperone for flagella basal body P-ring formation